MVPSCEMWSLIRQGTNLRVIAVIAEHSRTRQELDECSWLRPGGGHEVSWVATPRVVGLSSLDPEG